jgi:hypothetical protein
MKNGLSLKTLSSKESYSQILTDLKDLIDLCSEQDNIPIYFCVGGYFIDILVARKLQKLIGDGVSTQDSEQFSSMKKELYEQFLKADCIVKKIESVSIFVDPDEPYIALYYINTQRQAVAGELCISSGQPIEKVKFTEEDILESFHFNSLQH